MPEAVIVATARSPIGRAFKGSLKDLRPDDLAATIVRAALDKVPALDPRDIDDLMLGCGLPGGEQGYNMGRVVATLLGMDHLPGTKNPVFADAEARVAKVAESGADSWHDPRQDGEIPDIFIDMAQTAENLALLKDVSRQEMDEFAVRSQ